MDRRTLLRAAVAGAFAGGLAGCGISTHDGVVVDEPVARDSLGGASGTPSAPPGRSAADNPRQFVRNFLCQPAGDDGPEGAKARCRSYMNAEGRAGWDSGNEVTVVWFDDEALADREPSAQNDSFLITVDMYPLGVLKDGRMQPSAATGPVTVTFTVTPSRPLTKDYYISGIKNWSSTMMLSSAALATYYDYRNLYYWSESDSEVLVPDPRYFYKSSQNPPARQMIEMLLAGPATWLDHVREVGTNVKIKDNPVIDGDKIIVNLSQQAATLDAKRLVAQLTWTLKAEVDAITADDASPVQLKIESALKQQGGPYKAANTATRRPAQPKRSYVVADGKVRRLGGGEDSLFEGVNQNVVSAACVARPDNPETPAVAALVREDAEGRQQLVIVPRTDASAEMLKVDFGKGEVKFLPPVFLDPDTLLVVANGTLHRVLRQGGNSSPTPLSVHGVANGSIRAFALSPEGRRLAIVAGGGLFVAPVTARGKNTIQHSARVPTVLTSLSGVGFTGESWLAVSGLFNGDMRIVQISLDGALVGRGQGPTWVEAKTGLPNVTSLTTYPANPGQRYAPDTSETVYTANGRAYRARGMALRNELNPAPETNPVNPFFLE